MRRLLTTLLILTASGAALAAADYLEAARRATLKEKQQACQLARWSVERSARGTSAHPLPFKLEGYLNLPAPCFVTIIHENRRRGCTGSFTPRSSSLGQDIVLTARRAWELDPRTRRLTPEQLKKSTFNVTIPGPRIPVGDPSRYPPAEYGLLLQGGGKSAVLLPGEARTGSWRLKEARRQAGIPADAQVQCYVFRAITFEEKPTSTTR